MSDKLSNETIISSMLVLLETSLDGSTSVSKKTLAKWSGRKINKKMLVRLTTSTLFKGSYADKTFTFTLNHKENVMEQSAMSILPTELIDNLSQIGIILKHDGSFSLKPNKESNVPQIAFGEPVEVWIAVLINPTTVKKLQLVTVVANESITYNPKVVISLKDWKLDEKPVVIQIKFYLVRGVFSVTIL